MATLLQALRYSVRMLENAPGFATVAVLTFGAGHWREHSDLQSDRCEVKFTQSRHPLASDLMP